MIKVIVNGASGKMGIETVKALQQDGSFELVGQLSSHDDLAAVIKNTHAQVVVDFTTPDTVYTNTKTIITANAHPVIGTTGLKPEQISELQKLAAEKKLGGIIAPNFSIGAILMMRFAKESARYYPDVEIIEYHHNQKKDAPSGTAIKTALMIAEGGTARQPAPCQELIPGARGANSHGITIHSVRLPGYVANQEVIFGGKGETLRIKHDCNNREAFMPGVVMSCKKVLELDSLIYGLEEIL